MLVFKGPNILINQIKAGTFSPGTFIKSTLLMQNTTQPKIFLAATSTTGIDTQNAIDTAVINTSVLSLAQCKQTPFTKKELTADMRKAIATNEDV